MVTEAVSERRSVCTQISEALATGAVNRTELLEMVKRLAILAHEVSWDVSGHLKGRNDTPEMQQASQWVSSAQGSLTWAERHAQFALTFELARCIEMANGAMLKVLERLQRQDDGAAA
jgi:hypothetical protein